MYTRVFESILDSSINVQKVPPSARWLWVTMMLIADKNRTGVVDMPVERLAARAGLTVDQTLEGLALLSAPDPESTSPEESGRRIVPIRDDAARGWRLVNWEKYKAIANEEQQREQTRQRVAEFRRKKAQCVTECNAGDVTCNASEASTEAKATVTEELSSSGFEPDAPPMVLAEHLLARIRANHPGAKQPNLQKWARAIDLMIRRDNRTPEDIRKIIDFAQGDSFWMGNILSADKLREKFDTLTLQSRRNNGNGAGTSAGRRANHPGSAGTAEEAPANPLGNFGMRSADDVIAELAAKRKLPEVQGKSS